MLEKLLRSKAEVRVLGIVLFSQGLHLREIARRAGVSPYEAKKELDNLVSIGLLVSEKRGNQSAFRTNRDCPFLSDLRNLYRRTEGAFSLLKAKLISLEDIRFSFVFGSIASGKEKHSSDIDLMVIGDIEGDDLAKSIMDVQKTIQREINFIHWTNDDLEEKKSKGSGFLKNLAKKKMVFLVGDKDEFIGIVEKGHT